MSLYLKLAVVLATTAVMACNVPRGATPSYTPLPTASGPQLSVEEYAKACYSEFEAMENDRFRPPTRQQMQTFISEVKTLVPPRSLEKFHYAYLQAWQVTLEHGVLVAYKEWYEAEAQIGQLDDETYEAFEQRNLCGIDDTQFFR